MKTLFRVKLERIVVTSHFRTLVSRIVPLIFFYSPTIAGEVRPAWVVVARPGNRQVDVNVIPQMAPDVTHICNRSGDLIWESMFQGYVVSVVVTMRIGPDPNEVFATARGALK